MMSYSRRSRNSYSPLSYEPCRSRSRSISRSRSRSISRSRSRESYDVENPGNNLYVTGLSVRVTKRDLEKHFSTEGTVIDVRLVVDPRTRESRGFGFVTLETVEDANRCIKYLNRSVLEGRLITVEKAKRRRGRTPTPGRYLGVKTSRVRRRSPSYSPYSRSRYSCPRYSSERDRSYFPYYRRRSRYRSWSWSRSRYSPSRYRSHSRSRSRSYSRYSRSPYYRRRDGSPCTPYHYPSYYARSPSPYYRRRDGSQYSPHHYRSYYARSPSPYYRRSKRNRSTSGSVSARGRRYSRSASTSPSPVRSRRQSRRSHSRSSSASYSRTRSVSWSS